MNKLMIAAINVVARCSWLSYGSKNYRFKFFEEVAPTIILLTPAVTKNLQRSEHLLMEIACFSLAMFPKLQNGSPFGEVAG